MNECSTGGESVISSKTAHKEGCLFCEMKSASRGMSGNGLFKDSIAREKAGEFERRKLLGEDASQEEIIIRRLMKIFNKSEG